jgi:hypothetical protein
LAIFELRFNQEREYCKIHKITKITMGSTCTRSQNGPNKKSQKINGMGTIFIRTSRKTKTEMDRLSGRESKEDESEKLKGELPV